MGYTHYYKHTQDIAPRTWAKICADVRTILAATTIPIVNGMGDAGTLNGAGDDSYETLHVTRAACDFAFCKTARNPYDTVVCAVLVAVASRCAGFKLTSDGDAGDFAKGLDLCTFAMITINAKRALAGVESAAARDARMAAYRARTAGV